MKTYQYLQQTVFWPTSQYHRKYTYLA